MNWVLSTGLGAGELSSRSVRFWRLLERNHGGVRFADLLEETEGTEVASAAGGPRDRRLSVLADEG